MLPGVTSWVFLALCACILVVAGVVFVVWRQRPEPGATELSALLVAILFWATVYAGGFVTYDDALRRLLERVMWIGVTTVPVAWLVFALAYTGRRKWLDGRVVGQLLGVSAVISLLVFANPAHRLVWKTNEPVVVGGVSIAVQSYGPLFWPVAVYLYGLVLIGTYFLLEQVVTAENVYAGQSVALVVGAMVPTVANVLSVIGLAPLQGLDMTPYAFSVSGAAFGYAVVRYDMFEFVPATRYLGRDAVIENMRDAVIIVTDRRRVIETNPVARYAFDLDRETVQGRPLADVLGIDPDLPAPGETRELTTAGTNRTFEMTASPLTDWQDRPVGHVLVFRDVTERALREQRLDVLNRVLRHNLRNDLNVIKGHAELLAEELAGPEVEHADRIRDVSDRLLDIGETAHAVDCVMDDDHGPVTVDLVAIVEDAVASVREAYPDVRVETDLPACLELTCSHPGLVEIIAGNLVENAAEHNDAPEPRCAIGVETTADEPADAVLAVEDNGPPIPHQERETLEAGVEGPLQHGSGLGLWAVSWCSKRLGGSVTFETARDRGNRVQVRVPVRSVEGPRERT